MTPAPRNPGFGAPLPPPSTSDLVRIEPFDEPLDGPIDGQPDGRSDDRLERWGGTGQLTAEPMFPEPTSPSAASAGPTDTRADDIDRVCALLDADETGIADVTGDGTIRTANDVFLEILGVTDLTELTPGSPGTAMLRSLLDHVPNELRRGSGGTWRGEFDHHAAARREPTDVPRFAPGPRTLRTTVVADAVAGPDPTGAGTRMSVLTHDITAVRRQVAELHHRATHDELTGLADRQHVLDDLTRAIDRHRTEAGHVAVVFIDVDQLKYVNDAFGHRAGDQLIEATADRLAQAVRPTDRVARIGGDEFLVVAPDVADAAVGLAVAERIRRALTGRVKIGELDLEYSVSIGVALTDDELLALPSADAASMLVSNADSAMYAAKQAGRGRSIVYTSRMRTAARSRADVAARLARAVADGVLTVDYQPVYSAVSGQAIAAEALVRWHHPQLGAMDPSTFISVAEESGVIGRLGEQVLEQALDDLAIWHHSRRVGPDFAVHVNVSRAQLSSSSFVETVLTMLRDRRIAPHQLVLEARETSLLGRAADVERTIRSFRRAGVRIAVDNFGPGPKSLAVMTDVGADVLKLDGSLALPAGSTDTDTRLVRAIALLAHALGMNVVAERVSSGEQLDRLRAAGCDLVQGHLLGEATPVELLDLESPAW